jgi:hypothetical protein
MRRALKTLLRRRLSKGLMHLACNNAPLTILWVCVNIAPGSPIKQTLDALKERCIFHVEKKIFLENAPAFCKKERLVIFL